MPPSAGSYDFAVDPDDAQTSYGLIFPHIPDRCSVLDVGCASGNLGAALIQRRGCAVSGVDIDADAVAAARQKGVDAHVADVRTADLEALLGGRRFDRIIVADVFEHLAEPARLLSALAGLLTDRGVVVASIPNISHTDIQLGLANDRWEYVPAGLLDRTHIRFFTLPGIHRLAEESGFRVTSVESVRVDPLGTEVWNGSPPPGFPPRLLDTFLTTAAGRNPHSTVYQFVTVLERARAAEAGRPVPRPALVPGRLDVIVRTVPGRLLYLRDALYSVAALTYPSVSVVLAVHGADPGFREQVRELLTHYEGLVDIATLYLEGAEQKRGYPLNAGLDASAGEYVAFLDDDDVLYPQFADLLVGELESRPEVSVAYGVSMRCFGRATAHGFVADRKLIGHGEAFSRARMCYDNFIPNNAMVIRRADLDAAGVRFDESLDVLEDWDLLRHLARWHEFAYVPQPVSEYRLRGDGTQASSPHTVPLWDRNRRVVRDRHDRLTAVMLQGELRALYAGPLEELHEARVAARHHAERSQELERHAAELEARLDGLWRSPVLRLYRALQRTGLHRPLRAAYRLAARARRTIRRLRPASSAR